MWDNPSHDELISYDDETEKELLEPGFAVFNLHINYAGQKANAEFIRIFGQVKFNRHIKPSHDDGIMSIFNKPDNKYRTAWICIITALVNDGRGRKITDDMMEADSALSYPEEA